MFLGMKHKMAKDIMNAGIDGNDNEKSEHFKRAGEGFSSDLFWGMIELIFVFSQLLATMNDWCVGCPCHPYDRCQAFDILGMALNCVLRGRRVAEICCGALEAFVANAANLSYVDLVQLIHTFQDDAKLKVVSNFQTGRRLNE